MALSRRRDAHVSSVHVSTMAAEASAATPVRNATARDRDSVVLTLSTLLQALQGAEVQVELRDDTTVTGVLEETDGFMK